MATTLDTETEESCTTYNMLKVSSFLTFVTELASQFTFFSYAISQVARNLFTWTKEMAYADYYEGALTNGVMGIQRGREPGVMIYMLPLNRGNSRAVSYHGWGTKFDSFWCCYGTGL